MQKKVINVNLGIAEDVKTLVKYFESQFNILEKEGNNLGTKLAEAIKSQRTFESHINQLNNDKKDALSTINRFKKMVKELGVDATSPEILKLESLINTIDEYAKLANSVGRIPQI